MKILRKTCRNIFLLSLMLYLPIVGFSQSIDIASGMDQVKGYMQIVYSGFLDIVFYIVGICSLAGLCKTLYGLYTDEHGNTWQKVGLFLLGFLIAAIGLYLTNSFVP